MSQIPVIDASRSNGQHKAFVRRRTDSILVRRMRLMFVAISESLLVVALLNAVTMWNRAPLAVAATIAVILALAAFWGFSLVFETSDIVNLVLDAAGLAVVMALAPDASKELVVAYGIVVHRGMDCGRRVSLLRPLVVSGAALVGAGLGEAFFGSETQWGPVLIELVVICAIAAAMTAISRVIKAHDLTLRFEGVMLDFGSSLSGSLDMVEQGCLAAHSIDQVMEVAGLAGASTAIAIRNDVGGFVWTTADGVKTSTCGGEPFSAVVGADADTFWEGHAELAAESPIVSRCSTCHKACDLPIILKERHSIFAAGADGETRAAICVGYEGRVDCEPAKAIARMANWLGVSLQSRSHADARARSEAVRSRLLDEVVRLREEERTALASDIHDGPVQSLSALLFDVQFASSLVGDGETNLALDELESLSRGIVGEVASLRQMMVDLLPPVLSERGLAPALREHLGTLDRRIDETSFRFEQSGDTNCELGVSLERTLYRLAQEALTNVVKHASASEVWLSLSCDGERAEMTIRDNGAGFDLTGIQTGYGDGHFGIASMHHRIEMVGGSLSLDSSPGKGTRLTAVVPVPVSAEGCKEACAPDRSEVVAAGVSP